MRRVDVKGLAARAKLGDKTISAAVESPSSDIDAYLKSKGFKLTAGVYLKRVGASGRIQFGVKGEDWTGGDVSSPSKRDSGTGVASLKSFVEGTLKL